MPKKENKNKKCIKIRKKRCMQTTKQDLQDLKYLIS